MQQQPNEQHQHEPKQQQQQPRSRLTKATASTAAIQPLEITMTAVVTPDETSTVDGDGSHHGSIDASLHELADHQQQQPPSQQQQPKRQDARRKQSQHRHHVKSPVFSPDTSSVSPLPTPLPATEAITFPTLPPPAKSPNTPSEAVVALQDAANESTAEDSDSKKAKKTQRTQEEEDMNTSLDQLFESCFFSGVMLLQWSNVVGPKTEKVWSSPDEHVMLDDKLQALIGRQVLNGEMGRSVPVVELKWIALHRQAILCAAFLYNDPAAGSLCALVFVLPVRYMRNFSSYFAILRDRVPRMLVEPLLHLRKLCRRRNLNWDKALEFFARRRLAPFIHAIMRIESVSLPCSKVNYSLLDQDSRQLFDSPFFARLVTSHLETFGSTVLVGSSLSTINTMINTLSLFLSSEERNRSSHARKNMKYIPDLYLQGLLAQDADDLEATVLGSMVPTTFVNMSKLSVKQTPLFPAYRKRQQEYRDWKSTRLEEELLNFMQSPERPGTEKRKHPAVFTRTETVAPMVRALLDDVRDIPARLREAYVQQWRRWLVRRAVAFIKFIKKESTDVPLLKEALGLQDYADFMIVLAQAEKLRPGILDMIKIPPALH